VVADDDDVGGNKARARPVDEPDVTPAVQAPNSRPCRHWAGQLSTRLALAQQLDGVAEAHPL
jgi:hypothetical protein